jgi:hypothetical protein
MKELFKALADFQQEVPVIHKGTTGYGYSYADLPTIFEVINPLLKKHGLGFTQELDGTALVTTIFHSKSGEWRASRAEIPKDVKLKGMNDFQVLGSAITYMRRYALSSALGLVTDKDTDASGTQVKPEAKPQLKQDTKNWTNVVEWLIDGGELEIVKTKYTITKENETELLKEVADRSSNK